MAAFTKALYYPYIDIRDEAWLKDAMLYWDEIQTIVPISIRQPYKSKTAKQFYDEELLQPLYVESNMNEIKELADDVLKYLESAEAAQALLSKEISQHDFINSEKMPQGITSLVKMYPDKIPQKIRDSIDASEETIEVSSPFADFYMTLLATRLSESIGAGLLTDRIGHSNLASAARIDGNISFRRNRDVPFQLAQGTLADLIFEKIQIDPTTPVKRILKFRKKHADEAGRFRTKIAKMSSVISSNQPHIRLRQQAKDMYKNEVQPAYNALKAGLTDCKIKWATKNLLKIAFVSTVSTSLPLSLLGLAAPQAILAGTGVSLTASTILYNREKAKMLRENPYAYLLAIEREFH